MSCSKVEKTDLRDYLTAFLRDKNKGISYDEWKNKKNVDTFRTAQIRETESCFIHLFDKMVRNANKDSVTEWLKMKNAEAKKIALKQKREEVCVEIMDNELEALKKKYSKKAFTTWLKTKEKENKKKDLRIKEDEACCNMCDEYFFLVKSEYNKKAVQDWLYRLKARRR